MHATFACDFAIFWALYIPNPHKYYDFYRPPWLLYPHFISKYTIQTSDIQFLLTELKAAVFQNIDETEIESVFNFSLIWAILARAFNNEGDDIFIFIE